MAITDGAAALAQPLTDKQATQLVILVEELSRWNQRVNLTAIREPRDIVSGHVLDSLAARPLLQGSTILDVGTGGGFPGLPLAIVAPALDITLLDSNGKKIAFVAHMIGELGLNNAEAVKSRVENYAKPGGFDTVIARAFAALPRIVELAGHLVGETGVLLALKGKYPAAELDELGDTDNSWESDVTRLTVPGLTEHERHAVRLRRRVAGA